MASTGVDTWLIRVLDVVVLMVVCVGQEKRTCACFILDVNKHTRCLAYLHVQQMFMNICSVEYIS